MTPLSGGQGNLLTQKAQLIKKGGVFLFHPDGTAPAANVACEIQQLLDVDKLHIFVACRLGCLFKIQFLTHRNAEHIDPGPFAPGNQSFEYLFLRHSDGLSGMDTA